MNGLSFAFNLKLLNLTPFKISLCALVNILLKDEKIKSVYCDKLLFEAFTKIIKDYECEISKNIFYTKLREIIIVVIRSIELEEQQNDNDLTEMIEELTNYLLTEIDNLYSNIRTLNDFYSFINIEIKNLKNKNENGIILLESGGVIDNYVKKCLFAFYKLSFEDIYKLYIKFQKYVMGEEIIINLTTKESENIFENYLKQKEKFEDEALTNNLLNNFNFRHKHFFEKCSNDTETTISSLHKFFDYNMKYFYSENSSSDRKIHYPLMNIIEVYFNNKYYEKAEQITFECIKLNQSNCDHEGLLKCFLWLEKIYKNTGKFKMAAKCLSTCLIKSFVNNYNLIFLIASSELAFLNYYFHSNVGQVITRNEETETRITFDEKILSYSNSIIQAYKNILQLVTTTNSTNSQEFIVEKDPDYYFKYVYYILIVNLLKEGKASLAFSFLKRLIDYLFLETNGYNFTNSNKYYSIETIQIILNLLIEVIDFDLVYSIEKIYQIVFSNKRINFGSSLEILKCKFYALSGILNDFSEVSYESSNTTYEKFTMDYLKLEEFMSIDQNNYSDYEVKLISFKNKCKEYKFEKLKLFTNVLISKYYLMINKITESHLLISKTLNKSNDEQTSIKAKLVLAEIYAKTKNIPKLKEILTDLEYKIEKYGKIKDRFNYYLIKSQLLILENVNNINLPKIKQSLYKCITTSLISCNIQNLELSQFLLSNLELNDKNHLEFELNAYKMDVSTLLSIFNKYKINFLEAIELIFIICNRNKKLFNLIN